MQLAMATPACEKHRAEERKRQEKGRIPFAESGRHKLPQCGRFFTLSEYSVLLFSFGKLCCFPADIRKKPVVAGFSSIQFHVFRRFYSLEP